MHSTQTCQNAWHEDASPVVGMGTTKGQDTMGDNPAHNANTGQDMQLTGGSASCNLRIFSISLSRNNLLYFGVILYELLVQSYRCLNGRYAPKVKFYNLVYVMYTTR